MLSFDHSDLLFLYSINMVGVVNFPLDVYTALRDFLSKLDFICLMNTSKILEEKKRKTVIFELNEKLSAIFLHNKSFKNKLLNSVVDSGQQVILNLRDQIDSTKFNFPDAKDSLKEPAKGPGKHQVIEYKIGAGRKFSFSAMKRLVLHDCVAINMDFIQLLTEVHLIDCLSITDVSCLRNVRTLYLSRCRGITDVSTLHKVHSLHLSHCDGVANIPRLTENSCLSVVNCPKVMDFSNISRDAKFSLEHPHFLQVSGLPSRIHEMSFAAFPEIAFGLKVFSLKFEFVEMLKISDCLELIEFPIAFLSKRIQQVFIQNCQNFQEISSLANIPRISVSSCNRLRSLAGLNKERNQEISLIGCRSIDDFSLLNGMRKVVVQNCIGFHDVSQLKNVTHLIIEHCWSVEDLSGLGKDHGCSIDRLELINNRNVVHLQGIEDIPELVLSLVKPMNFSSFAAGMNRKLVLFRNEGGSSLPFPNQRGLLDVYSWETFADHEVYLRRRSDAIPSQKKKKGVQSASSSSSSDKKARSRSSVPTGICFSQCICQ